MGDNDDDADLPSFLDRALPSRFQRHTVTVEPQGDLAYDDADWQDALVVVERGEVELEFLCGRRHTFGTGAVFWLAGVPVRALHNHAGQPAVLVAVSRRPEHRQENVMELPAVVPMAEWETALARLRTREKAATRVRDALAAERRRLPMTEVEDTYTFEGPNGPARLLDLFEGRRQLLIYHFMFTPGIHAGCEGCSMFVDNIGHLAHLHARDTSFALVSSAPLSEITPYRRRMGWDIPWYSSFGSEFNVDFGVTTDAGESFRLTVLVRDGDRIFRTYDTSGRGVEALGSIWTFLDLTPLGRQEDWEDSPDGRPQTPPYVWWRRHDEYAT